MSFTIIFASFLWQTYNICQPIIVFITFQRFFPPFSHSWKNRSPNTLHIGLNIAQEKIHIIKQFFDKYWIHTWDSLGDSENNWCIFIRHLRWQAVTWYKKRIGKINRKWNILLFLFFSFFFNWIYYIKCRNR